MFDANKFAQKCGFLTCLDLINEAKDSGYKTVGDYLRDNLTADKIKKFTPEELAKIYKSQ